MTHVGKGSKDERAVNAAVQALSHAAFLLADTMQRFEFDGEDAWGKPMGVTVEIRYDAGRYDETREGRRWIGRCSYHDGYDEVLDYETPWYASKYEALQDATRHYYAPGQARRLMREKVEFLLPHVVGLLEVVLPPESQDMVVAALTTWEEDAPWWGLDGPDDTDKGEGPNADDATDVEVGR